MSGGAVEERRLAVRSALEHPRTCMLSNSFLARLLGVSQHLVSVENAVLNRSRGRPDLAGRYDHLGKLQTLLLGGDGKWHPGPRLGRAEWRDGVAGTRRKITPRATFHFEAVVHQYGDMG